MEFRCEDLPQFGAVLVPPTSPEYDSLLADIRRRMESPAPGSPPALPESVRPRISHEDRAASAILLNRAKVGIADIHQIWTVEDADGRQHSSSIGGASNPSVLLPFGLDERTLKLYGYWHVILPGSKRYLNANGEQAGDNSDVRPPGPDEVWAGGIIAGGGGPRRSRAPVEKVTATLDGVFFTDGGYAGPNRVGLWERTVYKAEAHVEAANIARSGYEGGLQPEEILARIGNVIGPAPDRPPFPPRPRAVTPPEVYREHARQTVAWQIGIAREHAGAERAVHMVMTWGDARVPEFRKL